MQLLTAAAEINESCNKYQEATTGSDLEDFQVQNEHNQLLQNHQLQILNEAKH